MPDDIRSIISSGNIASIFGLYSFYHQSCTPSTLLLQKEIYPRKYFANPNSKFTNTYKRDHPGKDGLFTFMRKNVLLAEFSGKEFSVQTSDMLH